MDILKWVFGGMVIGFTWGVVTWLAESKSEAEM